ncbi:molybdopterin-containing oxidoreductase family protein [Halorhodospira halophila]|nr:molybdopterin-dependent oxidoreductase [Halorhodospira halophila]
MEDHVFSWCNLCPWRCGVIVRRDDNGRIARLEGNPDHPQNEGLLCSRGHAGVMDVYNQDRIKQPLLRDGPRGSDRWRPVSWDEALDLIGERLRAVRDEHGPQGISVLAHSYWKKPYHRLAQALGTPNFIDSVWAMCLGPRMLSYELVAGRPLTGIETLDVRRTRYFLIFGRNLAESFLNGEVRDWMRALADGAKSVYVDPRHTITADRSHEWLPIRPLTDHALVLALIHTVIEEELYDSAFVEDYCTGLDELRERVAGYTPEWAAEETDIDAADIRRIAREMAEAAPAVLAYAPRRMARTRNDVGLGVAIAVLNSLFGVWDRHGGIFRPQRLEIPEPDLPEFPESAAEPIDGTGVPDRYPLANPQFGLASTFWSALAAQDPYPVKAMIAAGNNAMKNTGFPGVVRRAIDQLDLFVATDIQPNETNRLADVILPEPSALERYDDLQEGWGYRGWIAVRMPGMEALHDTRDPWRICQGIAAQLGLEDYFPHGSVRELIEDRLEKAGYDFEALAEKGVITTEADPAHNFPREHGASSRFDTPSGKVELVPSRLVEHGLDDALDYRREVERGGGELHFLFGRVSFHTHTRTQNNPWLAGFMEENPLWIHEETASERGIVDGDTVEVIDSRGCREVFHARVTARIRRDAVYTAHGYGRDDPRLSVAHGRGGSATTFASPDIDPTSGAAAMLRGLVHVRRIEPSEGVS